MKKYKFVLLIVFLILFWHLDSFSTSTSIPIVNSSFETPTVTRHPNNPSGAGWIFNSKSGIMENGSQFQNSAAPNGTQACFLMADANGAYIKQSVTFSSGSYFISLYAAQRNINTVNCSIKISLGKTVIDIIKPSTTFYLRYNTKVFTIPGNVTDTLKIEAVVKGNLAIFIDDIQILDSSSPDISRPLSDWIDTAKAETAKQKLYEVSHPDEQKLLYDAGSYVIWLYGVDPEYMKPVPFTELVKWWQDSGAVGFEKWVADSFPQVQDRDHFLYHSLAISSSLNNHDSLFVIDRHISNPAAVKLYFQQMKVRGKQLLQMGYLTGMLTRKEYDDLRLYAMYSYPMWAEDFLPWRLGMSMKGDPQLGEVAPDFLLPLVDSVYKRPDYTDAYKTPADVIFQPAVSLQLLQAMDGFDPVPGSSYVTPKPYKCPYSDCISMQSSFQKNKPVIIILTDAADGYCIQVLKYYEPLYQATKDQIDWYLIHTAIGDPAMWPNNYFYPAVGNPATLDPFTMEERARTAKNFYMQYPQISIPFLLDDLGEHTQNTYYDRGGEAKTLLIDKNGIIAYASRDGASQNYAESRDFAYEQLQKYTSLLELNIKSLLDANGIYNGNGIIIPDWERPTKLDNTYIKAIDSLSGTITVTGLDAKDLVLNVDKYTRIIGTAHLNVGMKVSLQYAPDTTVSSGNIARLVIFSDWPLTAFVESQWPNTPPLWTPAVITGIDSGGYLVKTDVAFAPKEEMKGFNFWKKAVADGNPLDPNAAWTLPRLEEQTVTLHLDRATEVVMNGNKATLFDLRIGDRIGFGQSLGDVLSPNHIKPWMIRVYRYPKIVTEINDPSELKLMVSISPNPVEDIASIHYTLVSNSTVEINIYDALGRVVAPLINKSETSGAHTTYFNAAGLSSGLYYAKVVAGNESSTVKLLVK